MTQDGTITFYSEAFQEKYHSHIGAHTESLRKFIYPSGILTNFGYRVADIGFGLGYNSLVLVEEARKINKKIKLSCFELDPEVVRQAIQIHTSENQTILRALLERDYYQDDLAEISVYWGDVRTNIRNLSVSSVDYIFLDPFSPPKNPELWTVEFISDLKRVLASNGSILTYSSSLAVIAAFLENQFSVGYTQPVGRKRGGILAALDELSINYPLSEKDLYLTAVSSHAIPNRDQGGDCLERIQKNREILTQQLKNLNLVLPHKKAEKIYLR